MRSLAQVMPAGRRAGGPPKAGAEFARIKQEWQMQVAGDARLSETALRIALALPKWLNSKTLTAYPAQSTLAEAVKANVRTVRSNLRALEDQGHLLCLNQFRGGRQTNRYRIILQDQVIMPDGQSYPQTGRAHPVTGDAANRGEGAQATADSGQAGPVTEVTAHRGTLERTQEETERPKPRTATPPVSPDQAKAILAEVFGQGRMNGDGYLQP